MAAIPAISQTTHTQNADGSINVPQDGSQYIPQAGDMIRCDDRTNYIMMDVSRDDKNYFADGPVGPLPTATCDWSQFDQPELPKAEVRRFNDPDGDYIFIRKMMLSALSAPLSPSASFPVWVRLWVSGLTNANFVLP